MDDTTVHNLDLVSEANISDLISLRQNTYRSSASKPNGINKMITRGSTKVANRRMVMPPGIGPPPQKM